MKFPISLMALALTVCSVSASDFDKVLNTVVSNNMALKYADAENQAAIASLKSENTLDAPEITLLPLQLCLPDTLLRAPLNP